MSVKFTTCKLIGPAYFATIFARSITFCFALSLVYGGAWKYVASMCTPRFAIIYPPIVDAITPVPGGVGSVTTSVLVGHVVEAAMRKYM